MSLKLLYIVSSIRGFFNINHEIYITVADPYLELRKGRGERGRCAVVFVLLALPAFLPSVISSLFTQNKRGGGVGPPGPSPRSATV